VRDLCIGAGIPTVTYTRSVFSPHRAWDNQ
jgi:hypothetical protein